MPELTLDNEQISAIGKTISDSVGEIIGKEMEKDRDQLKTLVDALKQSIKTEEKPAENKLQQDSHVIVTKEPGLYKNMGDFALDVRKSPAGPNSAPERLRKYVETIDRMKAAGDGMETGHDSEGGFLIPVEHSLALLEPDVDSVNLLGRCRNVPMTSNTVNMPVFEDYDRSGGAVFGNIILYFKAEEAQLTEKKPKIADVTLSLKKLTGLCYASEEMIQDSPISLSNMLNETFLQAFSWYIDNKIINGTGGGEPLGLLNAACKVQVSYETSQTTANPILSDNVGKMFARVTNPSNSIWISNQTLLPYMMQMGVTVGQGGSAVFVPAGGFSATPYSTLLGRPVIFTEHCQAANTVGDIILFDPSKYLIGRKVGGDNGVQSSTSAHLKFDYDQVAFKMTVRWDGQPWWSSARTPRYGDSLSPIVVLQTRTG